MNGIAQFRKTTLNDKELVARVDALCDQMYQTGKLPDRQIPARPNDDFDILLGELLLRFTERNERPVILEAKEAREIETVCMDCGNPDCPCDASIKEKLNRKSDG
jgi:hypothetical protein